MYKRFSSVCIMLILAFSMVGSAFAADGGPANTSDPESGGMGGVVRPHNAVEQTNVTPFTTNLSYHGGPVMHTNKVYTIYWAPAGYPIAGSYKAAINTFFKNVAADSGLHSNVYYTDTQYFSTGPSYISYSSTFGSTYTDTHAFPASGCPLYAGLTVCLTDTQIRNEIKRVVALKGWVASPTTMFFMFTPNHVGSCFAAGQCAFTFYCAYHSYVNQVIYANQPYTNAIPADCGLQGIAPTAPNGFAADSTINVVSHEHNEAITDPRLNAWWNSSTGAENGDQCAWIFGPLTIGYNQTINGHHYILQEEWSNATTRCRLAGH
jgi:hypothetical protein